MRRLMTGRGAHPKGFETPAFITATLPVTSDGNYTDMAYAFIIDTASAISAGYMDADGGIRILDEAGNDVPYYIEGTLNTSSTVYWLKYNFVTGLNTFTIYFDVGLSYFSLYAVPATSIFTFFHDFGTSYESYVGWTLSAGFGSPSGSVTQDADNLHLNGSGASGRWATAQRQTTVPVGTMCEFKSKTTVPGTFGDVSTICEQRKAGETLTSYSGSDSPRISGNYTCSGVAGGPATDTGNYHWWGIMIDSGGVATFYKDRASIGTSSGWGAVTRYATVSCGDRDESVYADVHRLRVPYEGHLTGSLGDIEGTDAAVTHIWTFDETSSSADVIDIIANDNLVQGGNPTTGYSPVGGLRYLDGTTADKLNGTDTGADADDLTDARWSFFCLFRMHALPSAGQKWTLVCYGGDGETEALNRLMQVTIDEDGILALDWENGAGVNVGPEEVPDTWTVPVGRWVALHLIKRTTGTDNQTDVYIWGRKIATLEMASEASGGSSSKWRFGTNETGDGDFNGDFASAYFCPAAFSEAKVEEDIRRITLQAFHTTVRGKFVVVDSDSNEQDLSDLENHDWVDSFKLSKDVDNAVETCSVTLLREIDELSLSPHVETSKFNYLDKNDLDTNDSLLQVNQECFIRMARVPLDFEPEITDWVERFHGIIDDVDVGGDQGTLVVLARDYGGEIVDDYLETEKQYPLPASLGGTCGATAGSMEDTLSDLLTTVGSGGGTHLSLAHSLYAPDASGVCVNQFDQRRMGVMEAMREIAGMRAWDVRYFYNPSPGAEEFALTLVDPKRSRIDADGVFTREDYVALPKFAISKLNVRNRIRGRCQDGTNTDGEGNPKVVVRTVEDVTSQTAYGTRFMDFTEGSTSPIRSQSELDTMLGEILLDLKDPMVEASAELDDMFEVDIYDMHKFVGDRIHSTTDHYFAFTTIDLTFDASKGCVVSAGLRGRPSAGHSRWLSRDERRSSRPGTIDPGVINFGQTSGILESTVANLLNRTNYLQGGKFTQVRNGDFTKWTRGIHYPPDSWSMSAGVWETDADLEDVDTATGNRAVRLLTVDGELTSDYLPFIGSFHSPCSIELTWQWPSGVTPVSTSKRPEIVLSWYDIDKTLITTDVIRVGGDSALYPPFQFPDVPSVVAEEWFKSRVEGIHPPDDGTARFLTITVKMDTDAANTDEDELVVDNIYVFGTGRELRTYCTNPYTISGGTDNDWYAVRLIAAAGSSGSPPSNRHDWGHNGYTYDSSDAVVVDEEGGSEIVASGFHGSGIYVREDGTYLITGQIALLWNPSGAGDDPASMVRLVLDPTYSSSSNSLNTGGTEVSRSIGSQWIAAQTFDSSLGGGFTNAKCSIVPVAMRVKMQRGQRYGLEFFRALSGGSNVVLFSDSSPNKVTWISFKISLAE